MKRAICCVVALTVVGCAAAERKSKDAESPANAGASEAAGAPPPMPQAYPSQQPAQPGYPAPPPSPTSMPAQPSVAPVTPLSPSRQASADLDRAARELDVAAGDCQNACRALGSMDRAAGRICSLTSGSDDDKQRCADAKTRVYSARDKVKNSCGQCSDTSVDRNAPVPSGR